uniref:Letm1 RBD domain-containing protein n=1 Tax=Plectus sambesii TaxID=2011161 RepID=A0A914VTN5_9BILA
MLVRSFCGRAFVMKAVRADFQNYRLHSLRLLSTQTQDLPKAPQPPGLMKRYEDWLESNFPKYYHRVHRVIVDGSKSTLKDIRLYWNVRKDMRNGRPISALNKEELEVLIQCPNEMVHMFWLVVLLQIPLVGDVLIIAIIFLPRLILTRHFWTPDQREEFWSYTIKERQGRHYRPVAQALQEHSIQSPLTYEDLSRLAVNTDPLPDPRSLSFLEKYHLCRAYGILPTFGCIDRLERRTIAIQAHDLIIAKENLDDVNAAELHKYMHLRQLAFWGKSDSEMRESIRRWLNFSTGGKANAPLTLLMYAPILLGGIKEEKPNSVG